MGFRGFLKGFLATNLRDIPQNGGNKKKIQQFYHKYL